MLIEFDRLNEFIAGDRTILREFYNPNTQSLELTHSLAHAKVLPKEISKPHALKSTEIYIIQSGKGVMHIDDKIFDVKTSDVVIIPANSVQFIENNTDEDLKFFCIVEPAWKADDEIII